MIDNYEEESMTIKNGFVYLDITEIEGVNVINSQSQRDEEKKRFPRFLQFDLIDDNLHFKQVFDIFNLSITLNIIKTLI
jgi:hypothetical protein